MVRAIKPLLLVGLIAFLGACKSQKDLPAEPIAAAEAKTQEESIRIIVLTEEAVEPSDEQLRYDMLPATIEGDILTLKVKYGGGCGVHRFELRTHALEEGTLQFWLIHEVEDDPCKAFVRKDLQFDLSPLKDRFNGSVSFMINRQEKQYVYSWK